MTVSITQLANIKDVYIGTVYSDYATDGYVYFNSKFLSSTILDLSTAGTNYILTYKCNVQLYANTSYIKAFTAIQDYAIISSTTFRTLNETNTPRFSDYSTSGGPDIIDVNMGPANDYNELPYLSFRSGSSGYTWAYTIWVDGYISKVYEI